MAIVDDVIASLEQLGFKQVLYAIGHDRSQPFHKNTTLPNDAALFSGFILCCSLIETCGHFLTGKSGQGTSRRSFEAFIDAYLYTFDTRYDKSILYKALRCGLVHNFTPATDSGTNRDFYELTHNQPAKHLTPRTNPTGVTVVTTQAASGVTQPIGTVSMLATQGTYLNLQNFVEDLQGSMKRFFNDAKTNAVITAAVEKCARENGYPSAR